MYSGDFAIELENFGGKMAADLEPINCRGIGRLVLSFIVDVVDVGNKRVARGVMEPFRQAFVDDSRG